MRSAGKRAKWSAQNFTSAAAADGLQVSRDAVTKFLSGRRPHHRELEQWVLHRDGLHRAGIETAIQRTAAVADLQRRAERDDAEQANVTARMAACPAILDACMQPGAVGADSARILADTRAVMPEASAEARPPVDR